MFAERPDPPTELVLSDQTEKGVRLTWVHGDEHNSPTQSRKISVLQIFRLVWWDFATRSVFPDAAKYNAGFSLPFYFFYTSETKCFEHAGLSLISVILHRVSNPVRGSPPPAGGVGEFDGGGRHRFHGAAQPLPIRLLRFPSPGDEPDWLQRSQPALQPVQNQPRRCVTHSHTVRGKQIKFNKPSCLFCLCFL